MHVPPVISVLRRCALVVGCAVALIAAAKIRAQSAIDPRATLVVDVPAQSDALFNIPFTRNPAFEGGVATVAGTTITFQSPPVPLAWPNGKWTTAPHYVLVLSGALEGAWFTVTDSAASSVTVDSRGVNLATIAANTTVQIIPHWTLAALFPGNTGVTTTDSISGINAGTTILQVDIWPGTNLAAGTAYYFYNGTAAGGPGWRRKGMPFTTIYDQTPLLPGGALVYRNATAAAISFLLQGAVQMAANRFTVRTLASNAPQDLPIGLQVATGQTLTGLSLIASGAMLPTSSISGLGADELMIYGEGSTGFNPAATASYYYYNGTSAGGPGWRRKGDAFTTIYDATVVTRPGRLLLLRKAPTATPGSVEWLLVPSYLN